MLSYFGCDQSQVQRYLTAKSPQEGRQSLMMSAYVKIPLQALILLTGVLVFTFYLFTRPPMLFNPQHEKAVRASSEARRVRRARSALQRHVRRAPDGGARRGGRPAPRRRRQPSRRSTAAFNAADAALAGVRREAVALVKRVSRQGASTTTSTTCSRRSSPRRCRSAWSASSSRRSSRPPCRRLRRS